MEQQTSAYLLQLNHQLDKERHQSRTFEPVYDRDIFSKINESFRFKFNQTLSRLFLETRLFESRLNIYNSEVTRVHINSGVTI
ncbi:hypothetical protein [Rickettsiella massiliensis]|uniref:hypothetical protein n=1 Tax=Rickettsiella massiliensis TaxID=676517 RepID=UPI0012EAF851|nr:hypothetical protein [Rickettsiella massiliensis]